jgi:hypothetical protein
MTPVGVTRSGAIQRGVRLLDRTDQMEQTEVGRRVALAGSPDRVVHEDRCLAGHGSRSPAVHNPDQRGVDSRSFHLKKFGLFKKIRPHPRHRLQAPVARGGLVPR